MTCVQATDEKSARCSLKRMKHDGVGIVVAVGLSSSPDLHAAAASPGHMRCNSTSLLHQEGPGCRPPLLATEPAPVRSSHESNLSTKQASSRTPSVLSTICTRCCVPQCDVRCLVRVGIKLVDLPHFELVNELHASRVSVAPLAGTAPAMRDFRASVRLEIDGVVIDDSRRVA